jgi:hypothetical protein
LKPFEDGIEYVISSLDEEYEAIVHSEGKVSFTNGYANPADGNDHIPIETLKAQCGRPEEGAAFYQRLRKYGLNYGPSFQTIQEVYSNGAFALSKLKMADHLKGDFGQFILHPSMIDGALQTTAGLAGGLESAATHLPFALDEIDILHPVRQICYAHAEFAGSPEPNHSGVKKFNIHLLNESGDVLVKFRNLFVRVLTPVPATLQPALGVAGRYQTSHPPFSGVVQ